MPITIKEQDMLDLLGETVPYLEFCVGGTDVDDVLAKVKYVLFMASRQRNTRLMEHSDRTCFCSCGHTQTCDPCGFIGEEEL